MPDEGSISADPAVHVDILLGLAAKHRWSCLAEVLFQLARPSQPLAVRLAVGLAEKVTP